MAGVNKGKRKSVQVTAGSSKRRAYRAALVIVAAFICFAIGWFAWSRHAYDRYSSDMDKNEFGYTFWVPRYITTTHDGYNFSVKYPDPLHFTGNLAVAMPSDYDDPFTDTLIIWPLVNGGYRYGVILCEDDRQYQIYIDKEGNALDKEDSITVANHGDKIQVLLRKAASFWNI